MRFEETLCGTLLKAEYLVEDLKDMELGKRGNKKIKELEKILDKAGDKGQSMENRLKDYRRAVEGLGFRRVIK
jgi:hypothetical protein